MATRYQIQIMYANKDEWDNYFETYPTMTEASIGIIKSKEFFPHNKFRVVPVKGKEKDNG